MSNNRKFWIDTVKAICMICVYMTHCEAFATDNTIISKAVQPFCVNAFFFISGYLLYQKYLKVDVIENFSFTTYKMAVSNSLFKLAIPTIIFSTLTYLPKNIFHENSFNISSFIIEVLGGTSFWFTSALLIAQLLLLTLFFTKRKKINSYLYITTIVFLIVQITGDYSPKPAIEHTPWFWRTGFNYSLIMCLGGLYLTNEDKLKKVILWPTILISAIGYYSMFSGYDVACLGLNGRCNFIGFITSISATLLVIELAKMIKANKITNFIGKNSIVFYFFSGAIPAALATLATKLCITGNISFFTTFFLSMIVAYFATYIITKYLPFLLDIRILFKKK